MIGGIVFRDSDPMRGFADHEPPERLVDDSMRGWVERDMRMRAEVKAKLKAEGLDLD